MKTTIDIPDALLDRVRRLASEHNTTLKAIIEQALRDLLAAGAHAHKKTKLTTHTYGGKGLQAGLSWDDWNAIRSMGYEDRGG